MKKVDKGFEILYWRLSNRRKFIRTLWFIPIGVFALGLFWFKRKNVLECILVTIVFLSVGYWQIRDTYLEWKKEEN
ncbi:hypothetical protein [Clostridium oceanicum]|uniref:Uncharacterized protein n=1 Tax=Clostridium oceanicum TaxID=1543 RepID=A0ABP3US92_9CLOT